MRKNTLKFAFLNLKDHPRGCCMLNSLLEAGFVPQLIIEEDSSLAKKSYHTLVTDLDMPEKSKSPLTTQQIIERHQFDPNKYYLVDNQNDHVSERLLSEYALDIIVLGDTRLIKPNILELPSLGIVNVHPGFLPYVRGNNPYIWAIFHQLPFGCSVHFIDSGIDTGKLIFREKMDYKKFKSYAEMLHEINQCSAHLIVKALNAISSGGYPAISQEDLIDGAYSVETYSLATVEVKEKVKLSFASA